MKVFIQQFQIGYNQLF